MRNDKENIIVTKTFNFALEIIDFSEILFAEKRFSLVVSLREDGYGHYLHSKLLEGQEEYEYTSPLVTEDFANDIFCTVDKIYVTNLNFFGLIKEEGDISGLLPAS